jgi:hypothetical protein
MDEGGQTQNIPKPVSIKQEKVCGFQIESTESVADADVDAEVDAATQDRNDDATANDVFAESVDAVEKDVVNEEQQEK